MILHLDLDCFFVSAERIQNKQLLDIPVAVGGRSNVNIFNSKKTNKIVSSNTGAFVGSIVSCHEENSEEEYYKDEQGRIRGIITTCSYEARKLGVKTAMSVNEALSICPQLKMVKPNYALYHELSTALAQLLSNKMPFVEQFSIDEFFGDVTGWISDDEVEAFAKELKDEIQQKLDLPISIGVANTKYIAKLVTEYAKPNGVQVLYKEQEEAFIKDIKIEKFTGVGKQFSQKLHGYGISTLGQVKSRKELFYSWKKPGIQLYNRICGIDKEKVASFYDHAYDNRKSIGIERTFDAIDSREELKRRVVILCRYISFLVKKQKVNPQTFFLKIQYEYKVKSKNYIQTNRLFSELYLKQTLLELFTKTDIHLTHKVVQLNIAVSNFNEHNPKSYDIFNYEEDLKQNKLNNTLQELREKFGVDIVKSGVEI